MQALRTAMLFLAALLTCTAVQAAEYKAMTVRMACSTPPGTIQAMPLDKLAEIVERESGGKITFEKYYGGVLGDEQSTVKQLRSNSIQIGVMAAGNLTPFAPRATLVIMPYLFPRKELARKFFSHKPSMDELAEAVVAQSGAEQDASAGLAHERLPRAHQFQPAHQDPCRHAGPQVARPARGAAA